LWVFVCCWPLIIEPESFRCPSVWHTLVSWVSLWWTMPKFTMTMPSWTLLIGLVSAQLYCPVSYNLYASFSICRGLNWVPPTLLTWSQPNGGGLQLKNQALAVPSRLLPHDWGRGWQWYDLWHVWGSWDHHTWGCRGVLYSCQVLLDFIQHTCLHFIWIKLRLHGQ